MLKKYLLLISMFELYLRSNKKTNLLFSLFRGEYAAYEETFLATEEAVTITYYELYDLSKAIVLKQKAKFPYARVPELYCVLFLKIICT